MYHIACHMVAISTCKKDAEIILHGDNESFANTIDANKRAP